MQPGAIYKIPKLICRQNFTAGSRAWKIGEVFDWQSEGLAERRVRQMWDQRTVGSEAEMAIDGARYDARRAAEEAAKTSAKRAKLNAGPRIEVPGGEDGPDDEDDITDDVTHAPLTAEDLGL